MVVKNKIYSMYGIVATFFMAVFYQGISQEKINPYANTRTETRSKTPVTIPINPLEINVLSAVNATTSPNLLKDIKNYMFLWANSTGTGPFSFRWKAQAPKSDTYGVTAIVLGEEATLTITSNSTKNTKSIAEKDWSRISLGTIKLTKGSNEIEVKITSDKPVRLSSIELTQPKTENKILADALRMRRNANWFKDAGYGLMFQWTNRATPQKGDAIKNWEDKINDFDLDAFINTVDNSGAAYVIWSATWGQQYISAPIKSLDKLIEGRTTKRDLLGEMADRLAENDIKLIFYYHYGYDCYHSKDSTWLETAGGYKEDKTELYENISSIVAELGTRYGDKLHGWFFDGSQRYYDSHFDETTEGILSASFKEISLAARSGNDNRILAYNSWILPLATEFQDFYAGEGLKQFEGLADGVFTSGKHKGLQAHSCFTLEKRWGHIDWNTEISKPKYSVEQLVERIRHAQKNRYPLSINLEMYEDGTISPASYEVLKKVRAVIRDK